MKEKYVLITTWNGEGYSERNGATVKELSLKEVSDVLLKYANDLGLLTNRSSVEFNLGKFSCTFTDSDGNSGGLHLVKFNNEYGVVILTNICEFSLLSEELFSKELASQLSYADLDGVTFDEDKGTTFIAAFEDGYDRMFVKL